ncbi:hypothetical protein [Burkholderia ambifaria]|uniref:hypothetical protein n=1 Tax=Burkholderia ambifaria TaxID=152480 RepID=UPI00158B46E7|nr:hypothetical protein [Burkholderia ambifaria]
MNDYHIAFKAACADLGAISALLGFEGYPGIDALLRSITDLIAAKQPEPCAEVTITAEDADMVWLADDGETFFHSIDDAVDCAVDQEWPSVEPLELKLSLGKRIPTATVRVFNITENGHEWEFVDAARAGEGQ